MSCSTSNLAFDELPPTQDVIADTQWVRYPCLTSIDSSTAPLEFRIDKTNAFTDINQIFLNLKCRVVKSDGSILADKDLVSSVNNFAYSMFSSVEMYVQDQKVTQDQSMYPWMSYVKILTGCNEKELNYYLRQALWRKDSAALFDQTVIKGNVANKGFVERYEYIANSKTFSMLSKLVTDFTINRLIPEQTEISLRFHRAPPSLCLLCKSGEYKIELQSAELLVPRCSLTSKGLASVHQLMKTKGLMYPSTRATIRTKVVSKNDQNCEWVPFSGNLPKRLYMFQISQAAFNGKIDKNIFNFQHFNLSQVCVMRNDESVPFAVAIPVDVSEANLLYMTSVMALDDPTKIHYNAWEFTHGYMLMCFDLTSDVSASSEEYLNMKHSGTLRVKLDYAKPLDQPITVFCIGEFDDVLVMDSNRNVHWKN